VINLNKIFHRFTALIYICIHVYICINLYIYIYVYIMYYYYYYYICKKCIYIYKYIHIHIYIYETFYRPQYVYITIYINIKIKINKYISIYICVYIYYPSPIGVRVLPVSSCPPGCGSADGPHLILVWNHLNTHSSLLVCFTHFHMMTSLITDPHDVLLPFKYINTCDVLPLTGIYIYIYIYIYMYICIYTNSIFHWSCRCFIVAQLLLLWFIE